MSILLKLTKAIAATIPGNPANIARAKRKLERELRAAGYSRTHATAEVSRRFANAKKPI